MGTHNNLCYNIESGQTLIIWTKTSTKHGIPRKDILYVLSNHEAKHRISDRRNKDERITLLIGKRNPYTTQYLEVMTKTLKNGTILVFHAMYLRKKHAYLIQKKEAKEQNNVAQK